MPLPTVTGIAVRRLELPLRVPYRLSYRTFEVFQPFLVRVTDADGRRGFGEGHISPGSSAEAREQRGRPAPGAGRGRE